MHKDQFPPAIMVATVQCTAFSMTPDAAQALREEAWWTGKHAGEIRLPIPRPPHTTKDDRFLVVAVPLGWIERDTLTELGCDSVDRAHLYSRSQIAMPVDLRLPRRRRDGTVPSHFRLADGGHRTAAARLRGNSHINALLKLCDLEEFMANHGHGANKCQTASGAAETLQQLGIASTVEELDSLLAKSAIQNNPGEIYCAGDPIYLPSPRN